MKEPDSLLGYSALIQDTSAFISKNFIAVFGLGLLAATGRFIQEGGSGAISSETRVILEIVVNLARILIVFICIGNGCLQVGFNSFTNIFRLKKPHWQQVWANFKSNFTDNWLAVLVNFIIYMVIAVIINIILFVLTEQPAFINWLKAQSLIHTAASKWPVLLFFKNISIIPFTLVFETLFVIWVVERNKLVEQ